MSRVIDSVPRVAFFLAGVVAATVAHSHRERAGHEAAGMDPVSMEELKKSLATLEARVQECEAADATRLARAETRLEEHSAILAVVPSTSQIVSAMEQLLSRTMASLDERLTTQAHSIEGLRTTVSQTDGLLERVLESLDSLQSINDSAEFAGDALLSRAAGA